MRTKFVGLYKGHEVKVKVTRAKKVENPYSRSVKLRSAIALLLKQSHEVCVQYGVFGFDGSNGVTTIFVT